MTTAFPDRPAIDMDSLGSEVARVVASLTELNGRSEPEFVRLGDGLERALEKIESTHEEISRALGMIEHGEGGGILARIKTFESEISSRFDDNAETIRFCVERMGDSMARLRELEGRNKAFAESVSRMNAIGIYFAIEIARSPTAFQVFSSYAADIRGLFGRIFSLFKQIGVETGRNGQIQQSALGSINQGHAEIALNARREVTASAETINKISSASVETLDRISKYFTLLGADVARILTAIQVGDITRQQIEHVIDALKSGGRTSGVDVEWCRLVSLQFAQLRHVWTELNDARVAVQDALDQIAEALGILAADVDALLSGGSAAGAGASWVAELTGELRKMASLESKTGSIFEHTLETVDQVIGALSALQGHVRDIGDNNRRLGLEAHNARILSMRLGAEGRALTTLAKEVSDLSHTTRGYMDGVSGAIGAIVAVSGQAGARIEAARTAQAGDGRGHANGSHSDIELLESETGQFIRLTSEACGKARSLQGDIAGIRKAADAIAGVEADLEGILAALGAVVTTLAAVTGEPPPGEGDANRRHTERYTMEAERLIHKQMSRGQGAAGAGIASSMASRRDMVVNEDEMGENVELF